MRSSLEKALASCAEEALRLRTGRFLAGLSCDELQFLAEYLGASILECDCQRKSLRAQVAARLAEFQESGCTFDAGAAADRDHKMILLREFLRLSGFEQVPLALRAGHQ